MSNLSESLHLMKSLTEFFASSMHPEEIYQQTISMGIRLFHAKGGVIRIENQASGHLEVHYGIGVYSQHPLDRRIAKRVFFTRTPLCLNRKGKRKPFQSILCVPFFVKGKSFGTLAFYDKEREPFQFEENDLWLLLVISQQLSFAIENAMVRREIWARFQEQERRVKQLSTLWELSKALLTTVHFERILHLTLTAITIGEGLGFNRAMLFMVDEKEKLLKGVMAVGPDSAEEAGRIWSSLSQKRENPSEWVSQLASTAESHSLLNAMVKEIKIPLEHHQCILSRTVLEGRPFNVQVPQTKEGWIQVRCQRGCSIGSEIGCYISEHLSHDPQVYAFATVPLWGKGKVIGVILVDNFYNQNPITEEDLQYLSMFCNQAGLAIENAMLYRHLEEVHQKLKEAQTFLVHQEKMIALGELSTSIAHEIRNPLVSIGGFARRLDRFISPEAPEKRYIQTIMKEVRRVEKILSHFLSYTHGEPLVFKDIDLRELIEESISMAIEIKENGDIQLVREFLDPLPRVQGHPGQLKQAFFNLISNARESMGGKGLLFIRVYPISKDGVSHIRVEVEDSGPGIDPENLHHIFNPFYSTKENHFGLGLPIVHKIVSTHQGQIEVDNRHGKGVTFIITLPVKEEKKYEENSGSR